MLASVADRLNELFDVMRAAHEPAATNHDVAEMVAALIRTAFTAEDLRQLRAGERDGTAQELEAIARCFGVSASLLVDPGGNASVAAQLRLLKAMRDRGVRAAGCSGRLVHSPGDADAVNALAEIVEGLGA